MSIATDEERETDNKSGGLAQGAAAAGAAKAAPALLASPWTWLVLAVVAVLLVLVLLLFVVMVSSIEDDAPMPGGDGELNTEHVPDEYVPYLLESAQQCDWINPPLLAAQIDQESNWDPDAVSPVGAQGLAQFMPGTWEMYGEGDPFDPEAAITAQGRYMCVLGDLMDSALSDGRVSGEHLDLMLASYNAGEGNVYDHGGVPPFPETEQYIPLIKEKIAKYTADDGGGGGGAQNGDTVHPAPDYPVTSPFGYRIHPITGQRKLHTGMDFGVPCGVEVVSWGDGEVIMAGTAGGYGNRVEVDHGGGIISTYSHAESLRVSTGDQVAAGDVVTINGTTGTSTGCHLHWEIKKDGEYVNPEGYLP